MFLVDAALPSQASRRSVSVMAFKLVSIVAALAFILSGIAISRMASFRLWPSEGVS